jgi:hypothetical protein
MFRDCFSTTMAYCWSVALALVLARLLLVATWLSPYRCNAMSEKAQGLELECILQQGELNDNKV